MRAVVSEQRQLITIGPAFLHLLEVFDAASLVQLTYTFDQYHAVQLNALKVKVTVSRDREAAPALTDAGASDPQALVDDILGYKSKLRDAMRSNREKVIYQYVSDVTSSINNDTLRSTLNRDATPTVRRSVRAVPRKKAGNVVSGQNVLAAQESIGRSSQAYALDLISAGIDPSDVTHIEDQVLTATKLIDGVSHNRSVKSPVLTDYLRAVSSAESVQVLSDDTVYEYSTDETTEVQVIDHVLLPVRFDAFGELFFTFEVIDSNGATVNSITKKVRTERQMSVFIVPKLPPVVHAPRSQSPGLVTLQVKQRDPNAIGVRIMKRIFNHSAPLQTERFITVGDFSLLPSDGIKAIPLDIDSAATTIFRVIPYGERKVLGAEFTSRLILPGHDFQRVSPMDPVIARRFAYASLTTRTVDTGIQLDVRYIPNDAVALTLYRQDMLPGSERVTLDVIQLSVQKPVYTYTDTDVAGQHTYIYMCDTLYRDGSVSRHSSEPIEYVAASSNLVDTRVNGLQVITDDNSYDVRFTLETKLVPTLLDSIRSALDSQGLASYFSNDILKERDSLEKLVAHNVVRVNLMTGERETFGIIPGREFSDASLAPVNAVQPLVEGTAYRYEVNTFLRQPETMFEKFVRTETDPKSKRTYDFSPAKFLHPVTLRDGNIVSSTTLKANHANDGFSFGNVGSTVSVDVVLNVEVPRVINTKASLVGSRNIEVSWKVDPNTSAIDHFLIARVTLDGREVIGKSHPHQENDEFTFIDELQYGDVGEMTYVIIPIMLDYTKGAEVATNRVYIDPREAVPRNARVDRAVRSFAGEFSTIAASDSDPTTVGVRGLNKQ